MHRLGVLLGIHEPLSFNGLAQLLVSVIHRDSSNPSHKSLFSRSLRFEIPEFKNDTRIGEASL
jgi:hypothetical protein